MITVTAVLSSRVNSELQEINIEYQHMFGGSEHLVVSHILSQAFSKFTDKKCL